MFAVKVVFLVILVPHKGLAKTEETERISEEPRTVKISRMLTRIGIGLRFKENHSTTFTCCEINIRLLIPYVIYMRRTYRA